MAHTFTWFGGMKGGEMLVTQSSRYLSVDGFALKRGKWVRFLIANLTGMPQTVRVNCPGLEGSVRIEPLDEETVEQAVTEPRGFRSRKDVQNTDTSGGTFRVEMKPYAVLCVKGQIAG